MNKSGLSFLALMLVAGPPQPAQSTLGAASVAGVVQDECSLVRD
jgi:hypothetical protein